MLKFKWETEFKETEIGEIPRDWEIISISEGSFAIIMGQSPPSKYYNKEGRGMPFIQGRKDFGDLYITPTTYTEKCGKIAPPNSVLLTVRAPVGDVNITKDEVCIGRGLAAIYNVNGNPTLNRFIYYVLVGLKDYIAPLGERGTTYEEIIKEDLENILIPYPPPPEQSRIATVLSWFDNLIENKKRQNEILEKVAMAIFKSWFVDFEPFKDEEFVYNEELGKEIPKEWKVKKLGKLIKIESGGYAPQGEKYFTNGKYPFVRVKHLSNQPCINGCDFINDDAVRDYKLKLFKEGSIIFQKSGESLSFARVNILPFDCYIVNHLAIVDSAESKNLGFIYCVLKNLLFEIIEERTGTALPYMKISDIQKKIILKPPDSILQRFHSLVEPLFQKIILNQKQIMVLRKIRNALLPKLVFGKLRVVEI